MKKALSILGILAVVGLAGTPALAAPGPGGHGGPGGHMHGGISHSSHAPHRGIHHSPPPQMHRHHHGGGYISVGGVLARRNYWSNYYGCNCQLGWNHHHRHCPYYINSAYVNVGIPIRF